MTWRQAGIAGALAALISIPASAQHPATIDRSGWVYPLGDRGTYSSVLVDVLELQRVSGNSHLRWDVSGWRGGDRQRFWFKSEGALEGGRRAPGDVDVQALYGRLISPYFDVQAGVRVEQRRRGPAGAPVRTFAVIGLDGLAPYHVDVEPALFVSHTGKVSGRFTASYDLLLTQRLVAQGRVEATISAQRDVAFGVDRGFDDAEIGIRLRHELSRELAPYIGVSFNRQFGGLAEAGRGGEWQAAVGLRAWF